MSPPSSAPARSHPSHALPGYRRPTARRTHACGWPPSQLKLGKAPPSRSLARLDLLTAVETAASQGVAERAGFTREGVLRSYLQSARGRSDAIVYSLLAEELE